jgi:hypothetical protein
MREIHEIRLKLYEEKKDLSTTEKIKKTNQIAQNIIKQYKLRIKLVSRTKSYADIVDRV